MLQNRYRDMPLAVNPENMINQPTFVASDNASGKSASAPASSPFFAIQISTVGRTVAARAVVFDSSQGYQLDNNYTMPLDVVITGLTNHYQFILNDLAHAAAKCDVIKMTVNDKTKAAAQFARSVQVYESLRGSMPSLIKTLHPQMGLTEVQFQENIVTYPADIVITNRTAIVLDVEPGILLQLGFYQVAEIGRQN